MGSLLDPGRFGGTCSLLVGALYVGAGMERPARVAELVSPAVCEGERAGADLAAEGVKRLPTRKRKLGT